MKRRERTGWWALAVIFLMVGSSPALADDMVFDADDDDMVFDSFDDIEHLEELIAEGKDLYDQGAFEEASLRFFDVLMDTEWGAEAYHPEATYELGKTLFRLELYQGALAYFGMIAEEGDFHPYFEPALRGLLLLSDVIPGDSTLTEHLSRYADYFPEIVPDGYRDRYAYLVGRYFYDSLDVEDAVRLLNQVSSASDDFAEARYVAGISHVANYDAEPAVEAFRDVLRYLSNQPTPLDQMRGRQRQLLDLTHLAMARVYYSTGQFDTSLAYYERIDRESPRWPDALFESSWGFFQTDQFNQALGNLHSLNSPFFADAYFPEGPILAAVIYFYNCNYGLVRDVLLDFDFIYDGIKDEIEAVLREYPSPMDLYDWGLQWRQRQVTGEPELMSALRSELGDRQLAQRFELVEAIDREEEVMEGLSESWRASILGDTLLGEAGLARSFAVSDAGELLEQRLRRLVSEIDDLVGQQNRILIEVARAERGEIEAELRAGMLLEGEESQVAQIQVSDEDLYWLFDGEYWKDELGFYFFDIRSQCRR